MHNARQHLWTRAIESDISPRKRLRNIPQSLRFPSVNVRLSRTHITTDPNLQDQLALCTLCLPLIIWSSVSPIVSFQQLSSPNISLGGITLTTTIPECIISDGASSDGASSDGGTSDGASQAGAPVCYTTTFWIESFCRCERHLYLRNLSKRGTIRYIGISYSTNGSCKYATAYLLFSNIPMRPPDRIGIFSNISDFTTAS